MFFRSLMEIGQNMLMIMRYYDRLLLSGINLFSPNVLGYFNYLTSGCFQSLFQIFSFRCMGCILTNRLVYWFRNFIKGITHSSFGFQSVFDESSNILKY